MKILHSILSAVVLCAALAFTGCATKTTLEPGGKYTHPTLAVMDQEILDASHALDSFTSWVDSNSTYLAKWPEVGNLAEQVKANRDLWVRNAIAARDAYRSALVDYEAAKISSADLDSKAAKEKEALAVIINVTNQINQYRLAHPSNA